MHLKDEALTPAGDKIVHVPIPTPDAAMRSSVTDSVQQLLDVTRMIHSTRFGVLDFLRTEYDVEVPGPVLGEFEGLGSDAFVREVKKRRSKDGKMFSPVTLKALRDLYDAEVPGLQKKRAEILAHERSIAAQVHAAYKLTEDDLHLLKETAPPRMPPGW